MLLPASLVRKGSISVRTEEKLSLVAVLIDLLTWEQRPLVETWRAVDD